MPVSHSIKRFPGLFGSVNPNRPAEGAADIDQDTVRRSVDVVESRRGFKASASLGVPLNAIGFKEGYAVAMSYGGAGSLSAYNPTTDTWSGLPMTPGALLLDRPGVSGAHTRFVSANKALYFQSAYGLTKIETISSGICRAALQPKNWTLFASPGFATGVGTSVVANAAISPAWLTNGNQVGYRFTLARFGANKELIESEPSDVLVAANSTGSTSGVSVSWTYSWMTAPDVFVRIWRTKQVLIGVDVGTEFFLIAEAPVASGAVIDSAGYVRKSQSATTVSDLTPDGSLYIPLYTDAYAGSGIAAANTPSPLSFDMVWFKSRMHHLNTSDVQRLTVRIIGTGTGGIVDGDTITIGSYKFTFRTAPDVSRFEVPLFTAGTVAQNIENTARQLMQAYNNRAANDSNSLYSGTQIQSALVLGYISSGGSDAGQILIQSVVPGAQAFMVKTSSRSGWDRDYTGGTNSDPNAQAAGWMWSALSQPEGVPTSNNNPIGDYTAAGQRLIALKETLFIFKADGLWRATDDGSTLGPQLNLIDPTIRLIAPETACAVDNMIFALCDQGVVRISETGAVDNISHLQIERDLFRLMAYVGASTLAERAFAVAYQPEHTFILCLPESPSATSCTKQYVFNLQAQAWVSWSIPGGVTCGAVHPDTGQLYFGRSDGTLCIERKTFDASDYQDPGFSIASPTATATASLVFTGDLRTGSTAIAVGDIVQQFQSSKALAQRVTAVSYSSGANQTTITLDAAPKTAWNQIVNLTIVKAIQAQIRFIPVTAGEPLTDKNWADAYVSFRYCDLDAITVGWASEKIPIANTATEPISATRGGPIALDSWGASPWGQAQWGKQARDLVLKCSMPQDFGHSSQLTLALTLPCALQRFELSAVDIKLSGTTDRVVR